MRLHQFAIVITALNFVFADVAASAEFPKKIDVFYDQPEAEEHYIKNVNVTYHRLNEAREIQNSISMELPGTLDNAAIFMRKFSNSQDGKNRIKKIVSGYQSVVMAFTLGVKDLPAIVIDERLVVYGTTDALIALDEWRKYQMKKVN